MRWKALLVAVPASGVAISLVELTRLPHPLAQPLLSLAALGSLLSSAVSCFMGPALLTALAAAALATQDSARPRSTLLIGLGIAQVAVAREGLIAYGPFAWSLPLTLALLIAAAGVAGLYYWLQAPGPNARRVGVLVALASLLVVRAHYAFFVGLYPTLHQCVLQLAFIGTTAGLGLVLASLPPSKVGPRLALAATLGLGVLSLVDVPAVQAARRLPTAHTELGRSVFVAEMLRSDRANLLPRTLPGSRGERLAPDHLLQPDADAEARFAANSGLPPLQVPLESHDILLVLTDATRFDATSLADPDLDATPHLRGLAERGAHVFTRAHAPSNGTFQSLASMLAMRPVSFADLDIFPRHWRGRLRPGRPTAPELMRLDGRSTFWVGHDHEHCFSQKILGLERGFDERVLIEELRGEPSDEHADAEIADVAVRTLEATAGRYFGLVFFVSPHDDYRGSYEAELRRFDAALGRVLESVDLSSTIVVVAGDHGEAFGEHGHRHHLSSVYDEQIHVPLLVWVPGQDGAVHPRPTSTGYVLPWLLLRGTDAQREGVRAILRQDVGPLLRELDGAVISEMIGRRRQLVALTWQHTTVVYDMLTDVRRVFDAADDPGQLRDLREQDPSRFERMLPYVERYRRARYEGRRFRFTEENRR